MFARKPGGTIKYGSVGSVGFLAFVPSSLVSSLGGRGDSLGGRLIAELPTERKANQQIRVASISYIILLEM